MAHDTESPVAGASTLALMPLPDHNEMSEGQIRGADCAWCGKSLTAETAVDLGERRIRSLDTHFDTFPRGCKPCTAKHAYQTLFDHCPMCEQCVDNSAECVTGRELRRLAKGAHL